MSDLPIAGLIDGIKAHLQARANALIIAPPGAGKSTFLPHSLMAEPWAESGTIILLQPRRIAVRNVASQLAKLSGAPLGQSVGYQMRGAAKRSGATRLLVMTEGVFRRSLLADPELSGVCAVLFDEYHERSLDSDLCLALCRDVQSSLRPDLRLIVMSATLDEGEMASALPGFKIFKSDGRSYPIETLYRPPATKDRLAAAVCSAVRHALRAHDGNILCFLPGQRDIRFARAALREDFIDQPGIHICTLFGSQSDQDQKNALAPALKNQRKVILATDIAETSLTVPGVHIVIDSGLRRAPVFDQRLGLTQLHRQRAGLDRLDQRRGRAGRLAPGVCIRLWAEQEMRAVAPTSKPDIETQDLTDMVLACADWGVERIDSLPWTSVPHPSAIAIAQKRLRALGLLQGNGHVTPLGRLAAQLPLPAELAVMALSAYSSPIERETVLLAALLSDGAGGAPGREDLRDYVRALASGRGDAAIRKRADDILRLISQSDAPPRPDEICSSPGLALAKVRPQLIGKARGGQLGGFKLAAGRGAFVGDNTSLAQEDYVVVGDAILAGQDVRIGSAWPLRAVDIETSLADLMTVRTQTITRAKEGRPQVERLTCIGDIIVSRVLEDIDKGPEMASILFDSIKAKGLVSLPWPQEFHALRARAAFAAQHGVSEPLLTQDQALFEAAETWLLPHLETVTSLGAISGQALLKAVTQMVPYETLQALDALAPRAFKAPAGGSLDIDYAAEAGPSVAAKLQAFFGLKVHPCIAGGAVPLGITLLSPAGRPLQSTRDLPAFWGGSYSAVRSDMRGRYPKHPWPENPAEASPTLHTKARQTRRED